MRIHSAFKNSISDLDGLDTGRISVATPSVVSSRHSDDLTHRYSPISTLDVIDSLRDHGFVPVTTAQGRVRKPGNASITRHMVRLQHQSSPMIEGCRQEVIVLNSHDGTSSFRILEGWLRFVCTNGLVSGLGTSELRVKHRADAFDQAAAAATAVIERARESSQRIVAMRQTRLPRLVQIPFAESAARIRWGDANPVVDVADLLLARRYEDGGDDLWSVFNRVQENVIRGGVMIKDAKGNVRHSRRITSISEDVRINQELFALADSFIQS